MTFSPSISSIATLWFGNLLASARRPSGVKRTCETDSPIATVSISVTFRSAMRSTLTELSARLATSASVPARLIDRPEGCLPMASVSISFGGVAARSITNSRLSGTWRRTPFSSTTLSELATSASFSSAVIARLVGGRRSCWPAAA